MVLLRANKLTPNAQIHPERYTEGSGQQQPVKKTGLGSSDAGGTQTQSKLDKVKQTLHMNK